MEIREFEEFVFDFRKTNNLDKMFNHILEMVHSSHYFEEASKIIIPAGLKSFLEYKLSRQANREIVLDDHSFLFGIPLILEEVNVFKVEIKYKEVIVSKIKIN